MLDAWCLMLEHLPDPSTKGGGLRPPPQRGGRPSAAPPFVEPFVDGSGRCSSIKHQTSSIKLLGYEAWSGAHDIFWVWRSRYFLGVENTRFVGSGAHDIFYCFLWFSIVFLWFFMVFHGFFIVFAWFLIVFYCFFKELDSKELEIHRYSLLDIPP